MNESCATVPKMCKVIVIFTPFTDPHHYQTGEKQTNGKIILKSFSSMDGNYSINGP